MKTILLFLSTFLFPLSAVADGGVGGFLRRVGAFIDTMSVSGVDSNYIQAPKQPWQIILQGDINQVDTRLEADFDGATMFDETWGTLHWRPRILSDVISHSGVWVGYRGYGVGYSRQLSGGNRSSLLKFGATGGAYGVNLRIHNFRTSEPSVRVYGYMPELEDTTQPYDLSDPIRIRLLTLDAYYLFNGRRFSYAAAYDQSVIQRRSSGSFMAGAMYYHSTISYAKGLNADFIMFMNDIGKMKQYQVSLGGGYAYNYVPCRGLLVSGMAMMMFTAYNRLDLWRYDSLLREFSIDMRQNPEAYGGYDEDTDDDDDDEDLDPETKQLLFSIFPMEGKEHTVHHSSIIPVIDARLSVTYNAGRWFFNANAQLHNFSFNHTDIGGSLTNWYVNASIGVRL